MRRLTGLLLAMSMFQLTTLDVRTECARHAGVAQAESGAPSGGGHEHHAAHAEHAPSAPDETPSSGYTPKCCMMAGTCGSSALASIVFADEVGGMSSDSASRIARRPVSTTRAPETPPPKA